MFCRVPTWVIPDSVKEIRTCAIVLNYVEIPVITIGYGLEKLGNEAFGDPQQLIINYKGSQTQWNKIEGTSQSIFGGAKINFNYTCN